MASGDTISEVSNDQMPIPKIRHEWYQTETHVIIAILAKNADDVKIVYGETTLSVSAKLPSGNDYSLEIDLAHKVVPDSCTHKVLPSKIEIKLKKCDGHRWNSLEGAAVAPAVEQPPLIQFLQSTGQPPKYPSSSKKTCDWDKIEKEITTEEEQVSSQGNDAVIALFKRVYDNGTDDVKRAMIKSYQESGGTVLSTTWEEVGKTKVERKTPDGMEWKPWDS
ncbi:protein SGT1 homolog [Orussus abietinus]|uniref:protein SGT1 homolog n=1 Tax=Orussus abietinus TaxID=222816 RepID=UPI0006259F3D|nr:protein SGT1 homolog [Orussus abietinus]